MSVPEAALEPQPEHEAEVIAGVSTRGPEAVFAARIPPPLPVRPLPPTRRGVFFDVENTSRAEHIERVLEYLGLDWVGQATELVAVGNWRVIGHEPARLLAQQGAHLVHSAPSVGVRDWSDLRIAVAAGVWLAGARPGDTLEIVTDDQAFDAVGDVAASLGVAFRRLSYRALTGAGRTAGRAVEAAPAPASGSRGRRRRRGGRRGGYGGSRETAAAPVATAEVATPVDEAQTAPHDEIIEVVRELVARSPSHTVGLDALSNELKARGFRRTPGSLRLVTRLKRLKEIEVARSGMIRLVDGSTPSAEAEPADEAAEGEAAAGTDGAPRRRRRRRGGRRRRGRGGSAAAATQ